MLLLCRPCGRMEVGGYLRRKINLTVNHMLPLRARRSSSSNGSKCSTTNIALAPNIYDARSDLTSFNSHGLVAIQAFNSTLQTLKLYELSTDLSVGQHVINRRRQPAVVVPSKALPARATQYFLLI